MTNNPINWQTANKKYNAMIGGLAEDLKDTPDEGEQVMRIMLSLKLGLVINPDATIFNLALALMHDLRSYQATHSNDQASEMTIKE